VGAWWTQGSEAQPMGWNYASPSGKGVGAWWTQGSEAQPVGWNYASPSGKGVGAWWTYRGVAATKEWNTEHRPSPKRATARQARITRIFADK